MGAPATPSSVDKLPRHIKTAVAKVRDFWSIGTKSLQAHANFPRGPNKQKQDEAKRLHVGVEKLRQARQFAKRCTKDELEQRIREAIDREVPVPPNWLVLRELYTLKSPAAIRRIWMKALKDGLNHRQIITVIRGERLKRAGPVTPGAGRKPKVDPDPDLAYARLLQVSRQWLSIATVIDLIPVGQTRRNQIAVARKHLERLFD